MTSQLGEGSRGKKLDPKSKLAAYQFALALGILAYAISISLRGKHHLMKTQKKN